MWKINDDRYIDLYDGKYGVINNNGILKIFRHRERWEEKEKDYVGDGFVLSLVEKIEELQEKLNQKMGGEMDKEIKKIMLEILKMYWPKTTNDGGDLVAFHIIQKLKENGYNIIKKV